MRFDTPHAALPVLRQDVRHDRDVKSATIRDKRRRVSFLDAGKCYTGAAMKKQVNMKKTDPATLDGAAWKLVQPVGNPTIDAAAVALDALAIAAAEYGTAKLELEKAEAEAAKCGAEIAERIKAAADRLRAEADRRRADADAYAAGVSEKCLQVAKIHPAINGVLPALMQYATGEVKIDGAATALINGWPREFTPEVTDANRQPHVFSSAGSSREKNALTSRIPASFSRVFVISFAPRRLQQSKTSTAPGNRSVIFRKSACTSSLLK